MREDMRIKTALMAGFGLMIVGAAPALADAKIYPYHASANHCPAGSCSPPVQPAWHPFPPRALPPSMRSSPSILPCISPNLSFV